MSAKLYNAKILLFGEYAIINGSHALAMPISQFYGEWAFVNDERSNVFKADLKKFVNYLDELANKGVIYYDLDLLKFRSQLEQGLYFKSNIPRGYGAGSSGALCAAVYERFSKEKIINPTEVEISQLKNTFAQMESFFHGESSGIDPLISFINKPVLIKPNLNSIVELPPTNNSEGAIFLLDTGIERKTAHFVELYFEKRKDDRFLEICDKQLTSYNEKAIQYFLNAQWDALLEIIHEISLLQLTHFIEMIPTEFLPIWKKGLEQDIFKLKLCGAGGGGFILGFTKKFDKASNAFPSDTLIPIFRF